MQTRIFKVQEEELDYSVINECARIIENGGIVAFPTETVYGLGVDNSNQRSVAQLKKIKKRSDEKHFSLHISFYSKVEDFVKEAPTALYKLIEAFWPGPLTLIANSRKDARTVGLRCPSSPIAQEIINRCRKIIAASSANFSDMPAAIDAQQVIRDFDGIVEAIIDAGKTRYAQQSSIVDLTSGQAKIVRSGAIDQEAINRVLRKKTVLFVCTGNSCRSVMAEKLLEKKLKEMGKADIDVLSAGTGTLGGMSASEMTVELLRRENIDASEHRSRQVTRRMLLSCDLILAMTHTHEQQILAIEPRVRNRLYLLSEFAWGFQQGDIPDPMGRSEQVYKECFETIRKAVERISSLL